MKQKTNGVIAKGIRVHIVLEFDYVESPDCEQADVITDIVTASTDWLSDELGASRCYLDDVTETLWVDNPDNETLYPKEIV
jgi:hypothetical protein